MIVFPDLPVAGRPDLSSATMTGQSAAPEPIRASVWVRRFKIAAGIIAALVGVIGLVVGIMLIVSQSWPTATGTVKSCTTTATRAYSSAHSTTQHHQTCVVTWTQAAEQHTGSVGFGVANTSPGASVHLRVNGDTAILESPTWEGYVVSGVGLLLLAGGILAFVRLRRRA
jgi:hypothetical protein